MTITKYALLPRNLEAILAQNIQNWEAQNAPLRAVVVGCYAPSNLTETTQNNLLLDRIPETISVFGQVIELDSFCLVADNNQLNSQTWDELNQIGKVFENAESFNEYKQQNNLV